MLVVSVLISLPLARAEGSEWSKYSGNPVLSPTAGSWDGDKMLEPEVLYDGRTFRMWYTGQSQAIIAIGFASSLDGFTWEKLPDPVLLPGPLGSWDSGSVGRGSVLWNGTQFLMWYRGTSSDVFPTGAIGLATSTDGISWIKFANNPIFTPSSDVSMILTPHAVKVADRYHLYFAGKDFDADQDDSFSTGTIKIFHATSADGMQWTGLTPAVYAAFAPALHAQAWDSLNVYSPSVAFYGAYVMWYSALSQDSLVPRIGYATSGDGIIWTRFAGNPILSPGPVGSWDSAGVESPAVIVTGTGFLMYYDGLSNGPNKIGVAQHAPGLEFTELPESHSGIVTLLVATLVTLPIISYRKISRNG